jgi:hypothetical protein
MSTRVKKGAAFGRAFLNDILDWIFFNLAPEDVFDTETLEKWAIKNKFVKRGK